MLRVLLAVSTVAWLLIGITDRSASDRWAVMGVGAATAVLWLVLLSRQNIGLRVCRVLASWWVLTTVVVVWSTRGGALSGSATVFLVPMAVFVALFLGGRASVVYEIGSALAVLAAITPTEGVGRALLFAVVVAITVGSAPAAVLLLARSARRSNAVDPDTGLPNGFGLARQLADEGRTRFLVAAVLIDGIGNAREALGYQVGTELLRRAVEDLGQVLPVESVIGRVAGDELVVTAWLDDGDPEGSENDVADWDVDGGRILAETLVRAIGAGRYLVGSTEVPLRAHVGLSAAPWDGSRMAELVRKASLSARRAADTGIPLVVWDGDKGALTADDLELLGDLRLAPERGEFTLAYQPQIDSHHGGIVGVEALLRWDQPQRGSLSPGRFIPLAERTGLIDSITEWAFLEALDAQLRWRSADIDIPVSVNLSAKCLSMPDLASWILSQLGSRGLPATCLTIEVTETAVADPEQALTVLEPLHRAGVRISIDDFGTGYTSLGALPTLPVDEIKVDLGFVIRCSTSAADEAIVRTVGELAHRLGLLSVAEGVEDDETACRLATMGIDLLQGFHFARPMTEEALRSYLLMPGRRFDPPFEVPSPAAGASAGPSRMIVPETAPGPPPVAAPTVA